MYKIYKYILLFELNLKSRKEPIGKVRYRRSCQVSKQKNGVSTALGAVTSKLI